MCLYLPEYFAPVKLLHEAQIADDIIQLYLKNLSMTKKKHCIVHSTLPKRTITAQDKICAAGT